MVNNWLDYKLDYRKSRFDSEHKQ